MEWLKKIVRPLRTAVLSLLLAYPASGVIWVIVGFAKDWPESVRDPAGAILVFVVTSLWFGFMTPLYAGFPISDEGGVNHINMYPYIIPTWLLLFVIVSLGRRWFSGRTSR